MPKTILYYYYYPDKENYSPVVVFLLSKKIYKLNRKARKLEAGKEEEERKLAGWPAQPAGEESGKIVLKDKICVTSSIQEDDNINIEQPGQV